AKHEVPRFVAVMEQIDLPSQWNKPLITRHRDVIHVYDLFKYENLCKEQKVLRARLIVSREDHFLVWIDFPSVPCAEAAEVDHVFVLFIQKMVKVAGDLIVAASVKPLSKSLHQRFFAVDVEAEEVDRLIKTEPLFFGLSQALIDI